MFNMIRNLEAVKERRYRMFLSQQSRQSLPQSTPNQPSTNVITNQRIQPRGKPMMLTGRRTMSMAGISGFQRTGSGCGCGS